MSIEAFEEQEELIRLKTKLELAEISRLKGDNTYTLKDSQTLLEKIYE